MSKIKTTHVGSLPRSNDLSELLFQKDKKEEIDSAAFDEIVKRDNLKEFFETFKKQKNAEVSMETISKSNHLFEGKLDPLMNTLNKYIQKHKS